LSQRAATAQAVALRIDAKTAMAHERWVFPLDCPDCKQAAGYPHEATTMRGCTTTIRIGLRCRDCRYEWKLELDTQKASNSGETEPMGGT
jgi:transposase-like protein